MYSGNNHKAFLKLLRNGLWGGQKSVQPFIVQEFKDIDWDIVYKLAREQSVQGLVLQGIEELRTKGLDLNVPKGLLLQWIGEVQMIEQRNKEMNAYIAELIKKLRKNDIYAILVKGQGIAQCYEKPLWRVCGDIDLLLNDENYYRAKRLLLPLSESCEEELAYFKHLGLRIDSWVVELHGSLRTRLSQIINNEIDVLQLNTNEKAQCRVWRNEGVDVLLPNHNDDILYIFTHILDHFYEGGVGLRQICDLCRLLWYYNDAIKIDLLEKRLYRMRLIDEWKAFAAFLVIFLGMPQDMMPLYSDKKKWAAKAERIMDFVIKVGNFGHNRNIDCVGDQSFFARKIRSLSYRTLDCARHFMIFPKSAIGVWLYMLRTGFTVAFRNS